MALRDTIRAPFRALVRWARRGVSLASKDAASLFGFSRATLSGVHVTDRTALESPEYFAGVRNVAEDLATLPLYVYRRLGDRRRELDPTHPLFEILHDMPNEEIDAVVFIEMMQAWLMMRRNAYAEIQRRNDGQIVGLWPIPPSCVYVRRVDGQIVYDINLPPGQRDTRTGLTRVVLPRTKVFHLKAFALDGILGESSIDLHKEAIGVSLALDRYGAAFFGNDATPGGVYTVPGTLTDDAYQRMKKELLEPHQGLEKKHRAALLEQGTTFKETAVPNDKAQFNESKRYSVEQMARLNRVPPHKVGDLTRASFSNIEHQGIDYVVSSIRTHAVRWERGILTQLFTREERRTHFAEFLLDALLRGDSQTRAQALAVWRQNGVINADEWRELENMNEIEDGSGKIYLVNGNMIPVAQAGEPRDFNLDTDGKVRAVRLPGPPAAAPERREMAAPRVFAPLFRAAAEACLRKEAAAVAKAVEREFRTKGMRAFEGWLLQFYRDQEVTIRRAFVPLAGSVGEAVRGEEGPDLGAWADEYALAVAGARRKAATESVRAVVSSGSSDMAGALVAMANSWASDEEIERLAKREAAEMVESLRRYLARETGRAA
jgi:HK97 family phage portal protein